MIDGSHSELTCYHGNSLSKSISAVQATIDHCHPDASAHRPYPWPVKGSMLDVFTVDTLLVGEDSLKLAKLVTFNIG